MTQRLPAVLTPLDAALRLLLDNVAPVAPIDVSVADAIGIVAAAMMPLQRAYPAFNVAVTDGWALRALDTVGASSYAPSQPTTSPIWAEAGDSLPDQFDCVLDADAVEQVGPMWQILAEAISGQGIRRAGDDIAAGRSIIMPGKRVTARDVLVARAAGIERLSIRSPHIAVIDAPSLEGHTATSQFILEFVKAAGARAIGLQATGRDAARISAVLGANACDLIVMVGGTGVGRTDATIETLAAYGARMIHGLALQPGRTAAVGKIGATPVIAVPGAPDQALAVSLMLLRPALDLLTGRSPRRQIMRPLARKISSLINVSELVLLETRDEGWMPIAVGHLSLDAIARADAWLAVPSDSEGFAAGKTVGAFSLQDDARL